MSQNLKASCNITHVLASRLHEPQTILQQPEDYRTIIQFKKPSVQIFNPYKPPKYHNPLTERSRKHRLAEERNTEIEKSNRILFEKVRKIKLKNMYHSEKKIEPNSFQQQDLTIPAQFHNANQLKLPQLPSRQRTPSLTSVSSSSYHPKSLHSSKSNHNDKLHSILEDRELFVQKYFTDLSNKRGKLTDEKELGLVVTENGWKVRVIQVGDERILLVGKKGREELTKKYLLTKVNSKIQNGLQEWVNYKFSFEG